MRFLHIGFYFSILINYYWFLPPFRRKFAFSLRARRRFSKKAKILYAARGGWVRDMGGIFSIFSDFLKNARF